MNPGGWNRNSSSKRTHWRRPRQHGRRESDGTEHGVVPSLGPGTSNSSVYIYVRGHTLSSVQAHCHRFAFPLSGQREGKDRAQHLSSPAESAYCEIAVCCLPASEILPHRSGSARHHTTAARKQRRHQTTAGPEWSMEYGQQVSGGGGLGCFWRACEHTLLGYVARRVEVTEESEHRCACTKGTSTCACVLTLFLSHLSLGVLIKPAERESELRERGEKESEKERKREREREVWRACEELLVCMTWLLLGHS